VNGVKVVSNAAVIQAMLKDELLNRRDRRARQLSNIAAQLHRDAPRGGHYMNMHGQPRSAPGEQPAIETGELLAAIEQGVTISYAETTVVVNNADLEFGGITGDGNLVRPRPLGRMAVAKLKAEVAAE